MQVIAAIRSTYGSGWTIGRSSPAAAHTATRIREGSTSTSWRSVVQARRARKVMGFVMFKARTRGQRSSSKATPKSPSGRTSSTTTMMESAIAPLR